MRMRPAFLRPGFALCALVFTGISAADRPLADRGLALDQGGPRLIGIVHETRPTETKVVAGVRIEGFGGEIDGKVFTSGGDGAFALPTVPSGPFTLEFSKAGYETIRISPSGPTGDSRLEVALMPEPAVVTSSRSGANDCTDLPAPPAGVPGLREFARFPVHHDGELLVGAARLPFSSNEGYVYRLAASGWVKNELDYILIRSAIPLRGGFVYIITFGGDNDLCGPWSMDARYPN